MRENPLLTAEEYCYWDNAIYSKILERRMQYNETPHRAENGHHYYFAESAINYLVALRSKRQKLGDPNWRPKFPAREDNNEEESAVQSVYEKIVCLVKQYTEIAFTLEDPKASEELLENIAILTTLSAKNERSRKFEHTLSVGLILLEAISPEHGQGRFPLRSDLFALMEQHGMPITAASMQTSLDYYDLTDIVRDNQQG